MYFRSVKDLPLLDEAKAVKQQIVHPRFSQPLFSFDDLWPLDQHVENVIAPHGSSKAAVHRNVVGHVDHWIRHEVMLLVHCFFK